jgi:hypothetical protein
LTREIHTQPTSKFIKDGVVGLSIVDNRIYAAYEDNTVVLWETVENEYYFELMMYKTAVKPGYSQKLDWAIDLSTLKGKQRSWIHHISADGSPEMTQIKRRRELKSEIRKEVR